jgi:23S rRNA pseudouridine2605 synthase
VTERLQKYLARTGVGSRREIENWIRAGRVSVDDEIATLGLKVDESSRIAIDGTNIPEHSQGIGQSRTILYHKPAGEICTRNDPKGRPSVFDRLPALKTGRWVAVGRLDFNTTGLLIFTTDGDLAHRLMHPSFGMEREYLCRIRGEASLTQIEKLTTGVLLDGQSCRFEKIRVRKGSGAHRWYEVVIQEGRYREVRRLWALVNCTVSRLIRIRYGSIQLPKDLRAGCWVELDANDLGS